MFEPLGAALIISATNPEAPQCWELQPGNPVVEGMVGWYSEGNHVLDVPHTWDTERTYRELISYGFCNQPELMETTNVLEQKASEIYVKEEEVVPPPQPLVVTDVVLQRAIGRAEGTRHIDGSPNPAYYGHNDPIQGGRCKNIGSFSYQHCANSPEEADKSWLKELRRAEGIIQTQSMDKFGKPLSSAALVVALDGWTQSPGAGRRFVGYLETPDPSPQHLIDTRIKALNESRRVSGGRPMNVTADQNRRVRAVLEQVNLLHQEQLVNN